MKLSKCPECGHIRTAVEKDRFCWRCGFDFAPLDKQEETND